MEKRGSRKSYGMFSSKRGISPLVATMFLIVFAISLGAIVMITGKSISEKEFCKGIIIEINKKALQKNPCIGVIGNERYLNFVISNLGQYEITDLQVTLIGANGIDTKTISNIPSNKKNEISKTDSSLKYDASIGEINEVIFTPYFKIGNQIKECSANKIKIKKIEQCT